MSGSHGPKDTIKVGAGTLAIYQEHLDRTVQLRVDSIERLDSSYLSTTYIICKGTRANVFVGLPPDTVERAIAEAQHRQALVSTRQPDLPFTEGPDRYAADGPDTPKEKADLQVGPFHKPQP
jgi:hypothetical protein